MLERSDIVLGSAVVIGGLVFAKKLKSNSDATGSKKKDKKKDKDTKKKDKDTKKMGDKGITEDKSFTLPWM